jgi:formylglycine-generating enzyme required for sulfatase activity
VWEWVGDWFNADYYRNAPARNPKGPATGTRRVVRGGSWLYSFPADFRAANRARFRQDNWYIFLGFRCAKAP